MDTLLESKIDYILTGIPRSGSTLLLKLLESNEKVVCFDEPGWLKEIRKNTNFSYEVPEKIKEKVIRLREDVKKGNEVTLNYAKGTNKIAENHFERSSFGEVVRTKESKDVVLSCDLHNQIWVLKSNIFFSATLEGLIDSKLYKIVATIRNPLSIIKSWRALDFSLSKGYSLIAEKYDKCFVKIHSEKNLLVRQVLIVDWFFKQYLRYERELTIFKYEDWVKTPHIINKLFLGCQIDENFKLKNQNDNEHYNHAESDLICECLEKHGKYYKYFYTNLNE